MLPTLVPTSPEDPAAEAQQAARKVLSQWEKPFLTSSDSDSITGGAEAWFQQNVPDAAGQPHTAIVGAGHFLQEDKGPELAAHLAAFVRAQGRVAREPAGLMRNSADFRSEREITSRFRGCLRA